MGIVIIKAAVSVFICCLIYLFFDIGTGAPFYSAIAAVICVQPEIKSTFRIGLNRTIGTLIGGFTGMLALFIIRGISLESHPVWANLLISACIIPLMYMAEIVKRKPRISLTGTSDHKIPLPIAPFKYLADFMRKNALTNITCIAFLSVTITHGADTSISGFAINRMIDTLIGVFVSFFINIIPFMPAHEMKDGEAGTTEASCGCHRCHHSAPPAPGRDPRSRYIRLSIRSRTHTGEKTNPVENRIHDKNDVVD